MSASSFSIVANSRPSEVPLKTETKQHAVVIDGENIAHEYGNGKFVANGIKLVLDYYYRIGKPAIVFLSRNRVDKNLPVEKQSDDVPLLKELRKMGRIAFVPARTHGDYYILHYGMRQRADIISNDQYKKEIKMQKSARRTRDVQRFLDRHLIPFTFVNDVFVPNPHPQHLGALTQRGRLYHLKSFKPRLPALLGGSQGPARPVSTTTDHP